MFHLPYHTKHFLSFQEPYVILSNGLTARGIITTIKAIARSTRCNILGEGILQEAEVNQWMEYCLTEMKSCCSDKAEMKDIIKV